MYTKTEGRKLFKQSTYGRPLVRCITGRDEADRATFGTPYWMLHADSAPRSVGRFYGLEKAIEPMGAVVGESAVIDLAAKGGPERLEMDGPNIAALFPETERVVLATVTVAGQPAYVVNGDGDYLAVFERPDGATVAIRADFLAILTGGEKVPAFGDGTEDLGTEADGYVEWRLEQDADKPLAAVQIHRRAVSSYWKQNPYEKVTTVDDDRAGVVMPVRLG